MGKDCEAGATPSYCDSVSTELHNQWNFRADVQYVDRSHVYIINRHPEYDRKAYLAIHNKLKTTSVSMVTPISLLVRSDGPTHTIHQCGNLISGVSPHYSWCQRSFKDTGHFEVLLKSNATGDTETEEWAYGPYLGMFRNAAGPMVRLSTMLRRCARADFRGDGQDLVPMRINRERCPVDEYSEEDQDVKPTQGDCH